MKVVIEEMTGLPPYHLYKNARILRFIIKCDCGEEARKTYIFEDLEKQKTEELQKKLEIAVDALKGIDWCAQDYAIAQEALNKITALEQKDVK